MDGCPPSARPVPAQMSRGSLEDTIKETIDFICFLGSEGKGLLVAV